MRSVQFIPVVALLAVVSGVVRASAADVKPASAPDAPKGWSKNEDPAGNTVYRPDGLAQGEDLHVTIIPGEAIDGGFRKWFDDKVKLLEAGKALVKTTEPHASKVQGTDALMQAIVCKDDDAAAGDKTAKHYLFLTFLGGHPAGRMEMIVLSVTSNELLKKHGAAYKELAAGWAASRLSDKPVTQPADGGGTDLGRQ